jgi:hypothetical protein
MTSVLGRMSKQSPADGAFYMPLSSLQNVIYAVTYGAGSGGSFAQGTLTTAAWATLTYNGKANPYLSSVNGAGAGLLKDMGKTIISANRTFRKVQLVNARIDGQSTNGVAGQNTYQTAGTMPSSDFLTGFIELGFEGQGVPAPVAQFGR